MAKNHTEYPITVIIGIGLLIVLGLLPFYCKSFMAWIYIAICCVIVVGLIGFVLHLRHNQKVRKENREALAENPKRIAIFQKLGNGSDIETTGTLDYPLLRHPKGYDVKWLYDSTREVVFFSDGLGTTVLQADGTTSIFCIIIVVGVLQGKVLDIEVLTSVEDGGCYADTLYLWFVDDDGLVHTLTNK